MSPITLTQGNITATLTDVYFSPATGHVEDDIEYSIESSISASADVVLEDGPAELAYDDQTFLITVTVLEFDDEEDEIDDVEEDTAVCHIMIDSADLALEKLAALLELEE